jgi:hypothetical protein
MKTFTITRYLGISETPTVILIDNPIKDGLTFTTLNDLSEALKKRNELVYFVADFNDNRIHGLDNWNDNIYPYNHDAVIDRIGNYIGI